MAWWLTPAKAATTSAAVAESLFNWNSDRAAAGFSWRIGVRLDDGSPHRVNLGRR